MTEPTGHTPMTTPAHARPQTEDLIAQLEALIARESGFDSDWFIATQHANLRTLLDSLRTAERERDEARRPTMWCLACGSLTQTNDCDCTKSEETADKQRLVNYTEELRKETIDALARADAASREVERLREALRPFAEVAASYDPPEGDDAHAAWAHDFTIGSLRRARQALEAPDE